MNDSSKQEIKATNIPYYIENCYFKHYSYRNKEITNNWLKILPIVGLNAKYLIFKTIDL